MSFNPTIARLKTMYGEFKRLNGVMWTKSHLSCCWNMASTSNKYLGRKYRYIYNTKNRIVKDDTGEDVKIPRDAIDHLFDFIGDIGGTYIRNIFRISTCSHPHEKVWVEWDEGFSQTHCEKCGGYLSREDVDRFLPPEDRHPELIDQGHNRNHSTDLDELIHPD